MPEMHMTVAIFAIAAAARAAYLRLVEHRSRFARPLERRLEMAAFDTVRPSYGKPAVSGRMSLGIAGMLGALAVWNDRRVTRRALSKLSDRELDDIGLTRGDIDRIG